MEAEENVKLEILQEQDQIQADSEEWENISKIKSLRSMLFFIRDCKKTSYDLKTYNFDNTPLHLDLSMTHQNILTPKFKGLITPYTVNLAPIKRNHLRYRNNSILLS